MVEEGRVLWWVTPGLIWDPYKLFPLLSQKDLWLKTDEKTGMIKNIQMRKEA